MNQTPATEQFIRDAIEGGWKSKYPDRALFNDLGHQVSTQATYTLTAEQILLDAEAWEAVGRVRGWSTGMFVKYYKDRVGGVDEDTDIEAAEEISMPTYFMHDLIDALASGTSIEDYLKTI